MTAIQIAGVRVGDGHPPYIIAEAAFNHHGDVGVAKEMIRIAADAKCDAIKFQTYKTEQFCRPDDPMYQEFLRGELPDEAWYELKAHCQAYGITFLSTPQNLTDLELLLDVGIPAVKIGSDDIANGPLLKQMAKMANVPFLLSCGMAEPPEVMQALEIMRNNLRLVALMVCSSQYPCPPEEANLSRIATLREKHPNVVIGYSDHTQWIEASIMAVSFGAALLEKHFALQPEGSVDHAHALGPKGLQVWVNSVRKAHAMVGNGNLELSPSERASREKWQRQAGRTLRGRR